MSGSDQQGKKKDKKAKGAGASDEPRSRSQERPPNWLATLMQQQMQLMQQQQKQGQDQMQKQVEAQMNIMKLLVDKQNQQDQQHLDAVDRQEQQRKDELERQERQRQAEIERQEKLRLEDIQRLETQRQEDIARQTYQQQEERDLRKAEIEKQREQWTTELDRQTKLVNELIAKNKAVEEKRLAEMIKLKEVHIANLRDGDDIENYLTTFERVASTYTWSKDTWVVKLIPHLTGKSQAAYAAMSTEHSNDYDKVKEAILRRYDITDETYRQRFRSLKKGTGESYRDVYVRLKDLFNKWVKPDVNDVQKVIEILIMEQLTDNMPPGVQIWVREHKPKSGTEAADLADDYSDARRGVQMDTGKKFSHRNSGNKPVNSAVKGNSKEEGSNGSKLDPKATPFKSDQRPTIICRRCKEPGHIERFCKQPKEVLCIKAKGSPDESVLSYVCTGYIDGRETEIKLDSGADVVIAHVDLINPSKVKHKERVKLECVHGDQRSHPTATVSIEVGEEIHRVDVVVNEGAKRRVILGSQFPNFAKLLEAAEKGRLRSFEQTREGLVITRAQANWERQVLKEEDQAAKDCGVVPSRFDVGKVEPGFVDEFSHLDRDDYMSAIPKERVPKTRSQKRENQKRFLAQKDSEVKGGLEEDVLDVDVNKLRKMQVDDKSLDVLRSRLVDRKGSEEVEIESKDGILFRNVVLRGHSEKVEQLIVPKPLRHRVLKTAHDIPLSGHLGKKKTLDRIHQRFFWPGVRRDVTAYCRSCETCQLTSKYKTKLRAPMISLPVVGQPFEKIAMDIVGPLERSKNGNKYVLVICDYATRYPEAIPLRSIEAKKIANELVKLFSRVGIPKEILTDQGSNFTSKLLKEIYQMLSIKGVTTSPYHPQTDGLVERFNGTLKSMIRKFVDEDPRGWDEMLPYLLFAYREVAQESTGFSPFELLYGWKVRGPLDVMKEVWAGTVTGSQNVVSHVLQMRERLSSMTDLVKQNMEAAQKKQKQWYDVKAKVREFKPEDEVLLLLPSSSISLEAKWLGPYKVVRKMGPVDYEIEMGDRRKKRKIFHVNLLKEFVRRVPEVLIGVGIKDVIGDEEGQDKDLTWTGDSLEDTGICIDGGLSLDQKDELSSLLSEYDEVFQNRPGKTTVIDHDIEMEPGVIPVRQRPYRIPQAKLEKAKREVEMMLELGVIEESNSPWSSPFILVPKPDGTPRFCVNYKKVNKLSKFDAYPMPLMEEVIERIGPAKYIVKLDLCKGYWQVPLTERSKQYTAFATPTGLYQFKYLPFGLHGAPATFQRMMDHLLRGKEEFAAAYMDDLVIFSDDWESHLIHLRDVLGTLKHANLTAKPSKCSFGQTHVSYLGHIVGSGQVKPQQTKIDAIEKWDKPKTKTDVKSFLGVTGYYRKFIANYADTAAPLSDLTRKSNPTNVVWTPESERAFQTLKETLCDDSVLSMPDFSKEFVLQTDASDRGLGAVLSQIGVDGKEHPVVFLSRKLKSNEENYATIEKECLAIKWAIESLQYYLLGREFRVVTDHQPLKWLNEAKEKNKRLTRWSLDLQPFCFQVEHRKGRANGNADGLSRR